MSDEQRRQPQSNPNAYRHAQRSSGTGTLVAGVAAVALLLGGGYYAWSHYGKGGQPTTTAAEDSSSFSSPSAYDAGRGTTVQEATANAAPAYDAPVSPAPEEKTATAAPAKPRTSAAAKAPAEKPTTLAAADIPTETIGVSDSEVIASQSDEVVVNAPKRPVWKYTPSKTKLAAYYPEDALQRGREGEASLSCTIEKHGTLDCVRVSEFPARAGFGTAAMRVANNFRHAELRSDGQSAIGTQINLRVLFRVPENEREHRG